MDEETEHNDNRINYLADKTGILDEQFFEDVEQVNRFEIWIQADRKKVFDRTLKKQKQIKF